MAQQFHLLRYYIFNFSPEKINLGRIYKYIWRGKHVHRPAVRNSINPSADVVNVQLINLPFFSIHYSEQALRNSYGQLSFVVAFKLNNERPPHHQCTSRGVEKKHRMEKGKATFCSRLFRYHLDIRHNIFSHFLKEKDEISVHSILFV